MDERKCRTCKQSKPLTKEFFYENNRKTGHYNFYTECKICNNERRKYNRAKRKLRQDQDKKDEWMEKFKNQKFICKQCGQEKTFAQMKKKYSEKRVHSWCLICNNIKTKSYNEMSDARAYARVLKERREREKGVNQND